MGLQLKSQMRARLRLSGLKVKRWEKFTEIMGFFVELRGMTMVCWWHAGTGSLLRSRGARVPALCYSRVYVTDVLNYWSYLQQPAFKGYGAHKKTDSFFLFTSRWLCLVCCIRTCSSPPIATLSAGKQRWGSTRLAAIATRQRFGLRVMNIFWWSAAWLLTVSGKKLLPVLYRLWYTFCPLIFEDLELFSTVIDKISQRNDSYCKSLVGI